MPNKILGSENYSGKHNSLVGGSNPSEPTISKIYHHNMKKKDLIKALELFNDDDELSIDDMYISYVPQINKVCGKTQRHTALYCSRETEHEGSCYCHNKRVYFYPDSK